MGPHPLEFVSERSKIKMGTGLQLPKFCSRQMGSVLVNFALADRLVSPEFKDRRGFSVADSSSQRIIE
jgi:hypothetical protein